MKINITHNTLHSAYLRYKNTFLLVFSLAFLVMVLLTHQAYGESVVSTVDTQIHYASNGTMTTFVTKESTVENALAKKGVRLAANDTTEPALTTKLTGNTITVAQVPARAVLISDNGQSWVGYSSYTSTNDILAQLKVEVYPEDRITANIILDPVTENAVGQKISIERAPVYTINVDDKNLTVRSWSKSVSQVLANGGIKLNQNDTVDPGIEAPAPTSGQIIVTRINYADVQETVAISYQTSTQTSYELYKGQSKVTQEGANGSKQQTVHVVYHNGVEVDRSVIASQVVSAPITKTIIVGAKPYNAGMWWDTIVAAGKKYGVPAEDIYSVMLCESGGQPRSGEGRGYNQPKGLFQYIDSTWEGSSLSALGYVADIFDGYKQIEVTASKVSQQRTPWAGWACKP